MGVELKFLPKGNGTNKDLKLSRIRVNIFTNEVLNSHKKNLKYMIP